jgi:hypothetical protein
MEPAAEAASDQDLAAVWERAPDPASVKAAVAELGVVCFVWVEVC